MTRAAKGLFLLVVLACLAMRGPVAGAADAPIKPVKKVHLLTKDMITVKKIKLKAPGSNHQLDPVLVAGDPSGGFWVSWRTAEGSSLQHFSDKLTSDRSIISLKTHAVMGLYGHDDGSVALTWFDCRMNRVFGVDLYLKKLSKTGKEIWNSKVRGDPGANTEYEKRPVGFWNHPDFQGPVVPIAFNGTQYGLFYVILQKFPDKACHTGDEYVSVNADGTVDESTRSVWNASHSFSPSTVAGTNGQFYGVTISDPFPYRAIRMGAYSQKPVKQDAIWPRTPSPNSVGFPPGTRIGAPFNMGGQFGLAIRSSIPKDLEDIKDCDEALFHKKLQGVAGAWPILLRFNESGGKAAATYITEKPMDDLVVVGGRLGEKHAVVAWGQGPGSDKGSVFGTFPCQVALLNGEGEVIQGPMAVQGPVCWNSNAAPLSNGDLVWAGIVDDWAQVADPTTLYIVRIRCPKSIQKAAAKVEPGKPIPSPKPAAASPQQGAQ